MVAHFVCWCVILLTFIHSNKCGYVAGAQVPFYLCPAWFREKRTEYCTGWRINKTALRDSLKRIQISVWERFSFILRLRYISPHFCNSSHTSMHRIHLRESAHNLLIPQWWRSKQVLLARQHSVFLYCSICYLQQHMPLRCSVMPMSASPSEDASPSKLLL